ncbi:hypothetical protein [Pseudomonas monteilii]|uniref:Uncharacterized protein n=1 Tax=Pseudomonas monteilii TaxID=76759 RepID=A0AAP7FQ04_9PSED|nr:hypothetical protein [Pseudomonas monteilii]OAH54168.1 hypothetical protein AYJ70_18495 [Pseudomonas monteilii]
MTDKIKIAGVPPKWDNFEYEKRVDAWTNVYRQTERSMELVQAPLGHQFLQAVIDKANAGYTITPKKDVKHLPLDYSVWMVKPLEQQQADIEEIKKEVKAEYVAYLESERERYQQLLREQLIQSQQEKELKAQQEKEAKAMVAIERQVQDCYAPLVIPE